MSIHAYISGSFYRLERLFICFLFEISPVPKERFALEHGDAVVPLIAFLERDLADPDEFGEFFRGQEDIGDILPGLTVHENGD
jgi:hypothetical protein